MEHDVSAALKHAKQEQRSLDLWQQALQAGRQARAAEAAQHEAPAKQPPQERQQ
jgi:hypothetical protein